MLRRGLIKGGLAAAASVTLAHAAPSPRLIVAELFTSQGCSSCPPADALLTELTQSRPDILGLAFHVTYWDGGGWRDPFSLDAATARQRRYASLLGLSSIYTPQLVVGGQQDVIGSDRPAVLDALAAAPLAAAGLTLVRQGSTAIIGVTAGQGAGRLALVGYDRQHRTAIGRGENGGRTVLESNIVRSVIDAGAWDGSALRVALPIPEGERLAILLQAPGGQMLGAARETA